MREALLPLCPLPLRLLDLSRPLHLARYHFFSLALLSHLCFDSPCQSTKESFTPPQKIVDTFEMIKRALGLNKRGCNVLVLDLDL
jgi:hypothetical protein